MTETTRPLLAVDTNPELFTVPDVKGPAAPTPPTVPVVPAVPTPPRESQGWQPSSVPPVSELRRDLN